MRPVRRPIASLARWVLTTFLVTFLVSRSVVLLIMSRRIPDLYLYMGATHVHHLNFGIFLLAGVGAALLFWTPRGRGLTTVAVFYGIGLGLTFDEFGMWLHLGGSYWQRASFDAIALIAGLLGLIAYAPLPRQFRPHHWWVAILLVVAIGLFAWLLSATIQMGERMLGPRFHELESQAPR